MNESHLANIPLYYLALSCIPAVIVMWVYYLWQLNTGSLIYAFLRMFVQLLLVGYILLWIFNAKHAWIVLAVLVFMVCISSWISLRTAKAQRKDLYFLTLASILLGGGFTLLLVTQFVLNVEPWYQPHAIIPLAGMIFSNSMNAISLATDRLQIELTNNPCFVKARSASLNTALIPIINSLFAVGLVALPGMMTGQILSGVSPLVAARYQIMVMCMLFGAAGLSTILYLLFSRRLWIAYSELKNPSNALTNA